MDRRDLMYLGLIVLFAAAAGVGYRVSTSVDVVVDDEAFSRLDARVRADPSKDIAETWRRRVEADVFDEYLFMFRQQFRACSNNLTVLRDCHTALSSVVGDMSTTSTTSTTLPLEVP